MEWIGAMASLHFLANPARFRRFSASVLPMLSVVTALALAYGLYLALIEAPPDYQQGETVRIMYVHVPSAWLSMMGYGLLAALGAALLGWRHPLAAVARLGGPSIHPSILIPLLVMAGALLLLYVTLVLVRTDTEIDRRRLEIAAPETTEHGS